MPSTSKAIAVFFDAPGFQDYPFEPFAGNYYPDSYEELGRILLQRGADFYIVRSQNTYLGNNTFSRGWKFDGTQFREHDEPITVDRIYNKGLFTADKAARLLNDVEMESICINKYNTYKYFSDLQARSVLAENQQDVTTGLAQLQTAMIVAKPLYGSEGNGIVIEPRESLAQHLTTFPYLLQEFMDTSEGIPGLTKTMHDFRIVIMNGEIIDVYIRTPKSGSLLANIGQGGSLFQIPVEKIPVDAKEILQKVETRFSQFPTRVYALDMCRQKNGAWTIIEINSQPGLPERIEPNFLLFLNTLADLLLAGL
ncbi:MAG: hypothetical protein KBD00_04285 [Candidatus Peribacteraceae bacterium]|nr:hypothetical protein [Candidatus Peribacteraceae bacterium]